MNAIPIEKVRELLSYDPETGIITNKIPRGSRGIAGTETGYLDAHGYLRIKVCGALLKAHRIAWALHFGEWPESQIDHINNSRSDNRISNLRLASHSENLMNCKNRRNNTSGFKGVAWSKCARKWVASITANGKARHLGTFSEIEDAANAYRKAATELHGEFANFGA